MTHTKTSTSKTRDLAAHAEQLPLLPSVIVRVLALNPKSDRYFEDLIALAQEDPTFAVRLIRLANAPTNAPTKPIATVRQAVVRIGARECAGIATALAVAKVFIPRTTAQRNLWIHSIQVAVASRTLANLMHGQGILSEMAYLGGLLHDIGRFVMFEGATEDLSRVDETNWHTPQELLGTERQMLGYDHVTLGILVCKRWSLPESLLEFIALHHDYHLTDSPPKSVSADAIRAVQMADLLSVYLMSQPDAADGEPAEIVGNLARACVRPEWPHGPVSPSVLAYKVRAIRDEASVLAESLLGPNATG